MNRAQGEAYSRNQGRGTRGDSGASRSFLASPIASHAVEYEGRSRAPRVLRGRGRPEPRRPTVNPDWRHRYETAVEAARRAGEIALKYFDRDIAVEWKADVSPVT